MNKEELIGFDNYKSIYSKPFELNLDYIRSQCHFMDKDDIYKWILSDEIKIINLKQALNEIRDKIVNIPNYRELHYFDGILQIIDKYTKED